MKLYGIMAKLIYKLDCGWRIKDISQIYVRRPFCNFPKGLSNMVGSAMAESYMTALRSFITAQCPALNTASKDIAICFLLSAGALAVRGECPSASEQSSSPP